MKLKFLDVLNAYMKVLHSYPSPSRLWMGKSFWINVYDADQIQVRKSLS